MSENSLIIACIVFVGLTILGLIQKYGRTPKKGKEDLCVLYMGKTYILTAGCNEKQCIGLLGTPNEAQRVKDTTILCYFDTDRKKNIKLYFKANKIQNFEYAELKGQH